VTNMSNLSSPSSSVGSLLCCRPPLPGGGVGREGEKQSNLVCRGGGGPYYIQRGVAIAFAVSF